MLEEDSIPPRSRRGQDGGDRGAAGAGAGLLGGTVVAAGAGGEGSNDRGGSSSTKRSKPMWPLTGAPRFMLGSRGASAGRTES